MRLRMFAGEMPGLRLMALMLGVALDAAPAESKPRTSEMGRCRQARGEHRTEDEDLGALPRHCRTGTFRKSK